MTPRYRIEPLARHDRGDFSCGEPSLDRYFRGQISQDARRHGAHAFVAVEVETDQVAGFYTLSASEIRLEDLPVEISKRLPRYPRTPAVLIGRLAVDLRHQQRRLGAALLADAVQRVLGGPVGAVALAVDPISPEARAFYLATGWLELATNENRLFLPLLTARRALPQ